MNRGITLGIAAAMVVAGLHVQEGLALAQATPVVKVCELLPQSEVKKLIGGNEAFDLETPKESPVGKGSSCRYPGVYVMVYEGSLEGLRKGGSPLEAIANLGDEAYLYNNPAGAVDLSVKVGPRVVVVERRVEAGGTFATVRPSAVALAGALVAKLR